MSGFSASPNALFETRVNAVRAISPGFVRLTFTGPQLAVFAPKGTDQRIKVLVPSRHGYPSVFDPEEEPVHEPRWRARWHRLPAAQRPAMRSYTACATRPGAQELDLDFFVHDTPGPASSWASAARVGERVLLSGPDIRRGKPSHGIGWQPGPVTGVLLAGDETAIPAMRGILTSLGPTVHGHALVEVAEPADLTDLATRHPGVTLSVCDRGDAAGGSALRPALEHWARTQGRHAAERGASFYAWIATESTQVAQARGVLTTIGIAPERMHAQGYWNARPRRSTHTSRLRSLPADRVG